MQVGSRAARHPMWANRSGLSLSARRSPPARQQLKPVPPSEHGRTRNRGRRPCGIPRLRAPSPRADGLRRRRRGGGRRVRARARARSRARAGPPRRGASGHERLRRGRRARRQPIDGRARLEPRPLRPRAPRTRERGGRLHRQGPVVGGQPAPARRRRRMRGRALRALLIVAGVLLGVYGYHLLRDDLHSSVQNAVASVVVAWTFLFAGIVAWARRPHNRMGILMTLVAYCLLERKLQYSHNDVVFTFGFLFAELGLTVAFAHAVLAYPDGRLRTRFERSFITRARRPMLCTGGRSSARSQCRSRCSWACYERSSPAGPSPTSSSSSLRSRRARCATRSRAPSTTIRCRSRTGCRCGVCTSTRAAGRSSCPATDVP